MCHSGIVVRRRAEADAEHLVIVAVGKVQQPCAALFMLQQISVALYFINIFSVLNHKAAVNFINFKLHKFTSKNNTIFILSYSCKCDKNFCGTCQKFNIFI